MNTLFDLSNEYDNMLHQGIGLSGEDKFYFLAGRVNHMMQQLPQDFIPETILDFGCGIGDTTLYLHQKYPDAFIIGSDISEEALQYAQKEYGSKHVTFSHVRNLISPEYFDLCYTNGVFHHIAPKQRKGILQKISAVLKKNAWLSFFENNPLNPATRIVMKRIPFDKNAIMLSHVSAQKLISECHFSQILQTQFLFYFPKYFSFMRRFERYLVHIPLGTQYHILAMK